MVDLFPIEKPPRAKRHFLMHVCDADYNKRVCYKCARCGHDTDWMEIKNVSTAKRGIPCPVCNQPKEK